MATALGAHFDRISREAERETQAAIRCVARSLDTAFRAESRYPDELVGDLLFLILGPDDRRVVQP